MNYLRDAWVASMFLLIAACAATAKGPLLDPIPEKIQQGEILVAVEDFVRVPKSEDSSTRL